MNDELQRWIRNELFDHVPVAICVIDPEFNIVHANARFAEAYGPWQGRLCHEVYKGRATRCARCGAAETFADRTPRQREEQGVDRDGKPSYYIVHLVPLVLEDGSVPYVVEMSTDVTETKRLQREKLEAERLAAVGQTVAGLAHGIKNILMGLEGGMYVVNSGIRRGDEERLLQGWKMLEEEIGRISSFVKEFLDFARGRTPTVSMTDPTAVARKVVELFRDRAASSGVTLELRAEPGIAVAPLDAEGLHTCLTNFVLNALDACVMSAVCGRHVALAVSEREGALVFEVTDDGCGMDYDVKQKVFTSFFSTKASGQGTGLGLLTTRKIVQEHGGSVSFESTEGEGSVFRIVLPRDRLPRMAGESTVPPPPGLAAERMEGR